jgi:DNA-binding transcriptional LysR family regulator
MSIDLRLLRFAKALADHGSFSKAAEVLEMKQPSLSRGIQELEAKVGTQLFIRGRLGTELTDAGRLFLRHAERILLQFRSLDQDLGPMRALGSPQVSVGLGPYVVDGLGARAALAFSRRLPAVRMSVSQLSPEHAIQDLRDGEFDLVVMEESLGARLEGITQIGSLGPLPGQVFVRKGHPLLQARSCEFTDVLAYPFAQVTAMPPWLLKQVLALRPLTDTPEPAPFPAVKCPSLRMALDVVSNSDAFAFGNIALLCCGAEAEGIEALELDAPWLFFKWGIFRLGAEAASPEVKAAIEAVEGAHEQLLGAWEKLKPSSSTSGA